MADPVFNAYDGVSRAFAGLAAQAGRYPELMPGIERLQAALQALSRLLPRGPNPVRPMPGGVVRMGGGGGGSGGQ